MRLPSKQTRFVIGCTVFQNSNSLPLALVSALAYSLDGLYWDQRAHDSDEAVASRGILYLLVFSQLGLSIRWSYGYNYLFANHRPGDRTENASLAGSDDEETGNADETTRLLSPSSPSRVPTDAAITEPTLRRNTSTGSGALTQFPALSNQISQTKMTDRVKRWPLVALQTLWGFMNPPLWAMLIALIVACVPGLQPFFFTKGTFVFNSLTTAVTTAGNCAVPLILVVLGGNLAQEKGEAGEPLPMSKKTIWTAIISRMVLVPLVLLPLLAIIARFAPISVVDDPIFIVVLFLLIGSPTAIQVASICQLNDVFEEEIATICWYSYAILTMPTTLILVVLSLEVVKLNRLGPWMLPP
jgi:predicted permease